MKTRPIALFITLCLGIVLATPALGQDKKKAKRLFDNAVKALERYDYRTALESFESAYDESPHWMVLSHVATCYAKLNRPVEAISTLEKYIENGGEAIDPDELESARRLIKEQRRKVGVLHLLVKPRGTEAKIDGESLGKSPFERILLMSGPHHIIAVFGDNIEEREINISAGQEHTVRIPEDDSDAAAIIQDPIPAPMPEGPEEDTVEEPAKDWEEDGTTDEPDDDVDKILATEYREHPNGVSAPFFVAIGVAAAGLITAGVGWGLYGYYNSFEKDHADALTAFQNEDVARADINWNTCTSYSTNPESGTIDIPNEDDEEMYWCTTESKRRDYENWTNDAMIPGIIGTAVFAVAGGAAILFYFHPEWFNKGQKKSNAALTLTPVASPSHTGLFLSGQF